jgi:hypothetical protein
MLRAFFFLTVLAVALPVHAQDDAREPMTLDRLDLLINAVDGQAERSVDGDVWQMSIVDVAVSVVTDESNDRMRILVPISYVEGVDPDLLMRLMQANFDTALDARYCAEVAINERIIAWNSADFSIFERCAASFSSL